MNDDDLEVRLHRLRPANPPDLFLHRLRAVEPPLLSRAAPARPSVRFGGLRAAVAVLSRPLPLAYAGLSAAWLLILILHLATPPSPPVPTEAAYLATTPPPIHPLPASIGSFSADRAALLTRNNPADPLF